MEGLVCKSILNIERVIWGDYMVHFSVDRSNHISFEVYPIQEWKNLSSGEEGFSYIDKENEPELKNEFEDGKCLQSIKGSFCWRGVWEGRLYFTDNEYWGEDIGELSDLYNKHIVTWCKSKIEENEL